VVDLATHQAGGRTEMPQHNIKDDPNLDGRLKALSDTAIGLGRAIQGLGASNTTYLLIVKELSDQLLLIAKRVSWLEKSTDPNWEPYDPEKVDGKRHSKVRAETKP
jgi:hypothetical protein